MTETIKVSESLELHAVAENHVKPLYQLICKNKTWLQQSALRNGFILEGCLKQAEFLNDAYDDVNLYARIIDSQ